MPLYKRATCQSSVVVSSSVYSCNSCDHTEIVSASCIGSGSKNCPKCGMKMQLISSQTSTEEQLDIEETKNTEEIEEN